MIDDATSTHLLVTRDIPDVKPKARSEICLVHWRDPQLAPTFPFTCVTTGTQGLGRHISLHSGTADSKAATRYRHIF
jgi:hypothetical protein